MNKYEVFCRIDGADDAANGGELSDSADYAEKRLSVCRDVSGLSLRGKKSMAELVMTAIYN